MKKVFFILVWCVSIDVMRHKCSIAMKKYMKVALASKRKKTSKTTGSKASPEKTVAEKALSNYFMVLLVLGKVICTCIIKLCIVHGTTKCA